MRTVDQKSNNSKRREKLQEGWQFLENMKNTGWPGSVGPVGIELIRHEKRIKIENEDIKPKVILQSVAKLWMKYRGLAEVEAVTKKVC